jgi:hypothetical protein
MSLSFCPLINLVRDILGFFCLWRQQVKALDANANYGHSKWFSHKRLVYIDLIDFYIRVTKLARHDFDPHPEINLFVSIRSQWWRCRWWLVTNISDGLIHVLNHKHMFIICSKCGQQTRSLMTFLMLFSALFGPCGFCFH